jgi:hypothetical protein
MSSPSAKSQGGFRRVAIQARGDAFFMLGWRAVPPWFAVHAHRDALVVGGDLLQRGAV